MVTVGITGGGGGGGGGGKRERGKFWGERGVNSGEREVNSGGKEAGRIITHSKLREWLKCPVQ